MVVSIAPYGWPLSLTLEDQQKLLAFGLEVRGTRVTDAGVHRNLIRV